jgi:transposase-like protein
MIEICQVKYLNNIIEQDHRGPLIFQRLLRQNPRRGNKMKNIIVALALAGLFLSHPTIAETDEEIRHKPMMGFKAFHSAQATIAGIETAHMIRKGQLSEENMLAYKQFIALAG